MTHPGSLLDVLRVDDLVRGAAALPARSRGATRATRTRTRVTAPLLLAVHYLGQLVRGLGEALGRLVHGGGVVPLQGLLGVGQRPLELALLVRAELLLVLVVGLLGGIDQAVELVAGLDLLAPLLVLAAVRFGLLDHALDVLVFEAA